MAFGYVVSSKNFSQAREWFCLISGTSPKSAENQSAGTTYMDKIDDKWMLQTRSAW